MSGNFTGITRATLPLTGNEIFLCDTQLTQGINPESETVTLTQLAPALGSTLPWVAGRFYNGTSGLTSTTLLTVTATLYAYPIYIPGNTPIKTLNLSVTTGQTGGAAHLGIYADNGFGYPGALLYDTGAITGLTATAVSTTTPATALTLAAGWYWVASIFTATSTFITVEAISALYTNGLPANLGYDTAAHALSASGQAPTGISVAGTYGALPATFTTGATLTLNAGTPLVSFGV